MKQPILLVLTGPNGSGKSTILDLMRSRNVLVPQKGITRPRRPDDDPTETISYFPNDLPAGYDIVYEYAGHRYGIKSIDVQSRLDAGHDVAFVAMDIPVLRALKERFPSMVAVWVDRYGWLDIMKERLSRAECDAKEYDKRRQASEFLSQYYIENPDFFDFTILNHWSSAEIIAQFEALRSVKHASAEQREELDLYTPIETGSSFFVTAINLSQYAPFGTDYLKKAVHDQGCEFRGQRISWGIGFQMFVLSDGRQNLVALAQSRVETPNFLSRVEFVISASCANPGTSACRSSASLVLTLASVENARLRFSRRLGFQVPSDDYSVTRALFETFSISNSSRPQ